MKVITVCGSMKFEKEMLDIARDLETKHGHCVIQCIYGSHDRQETLEELENIKTSSNKDADVKFNARKLLRELDAHMGEYDVILYKDSFFEGFEAFGFSITNDMKILVSAFQIDDEVIFITNDLCLKHIAK
jgi:hypothetical protein